MSLTDFQPSFFMFEAHDEVAVATFQVDHRKLHRRDGRLVICHLTSGVLEVMHTSRLIDYFHVVDDFDAAIQAVN